MLIQRIFSMLQPCPPVGSEVVFEPTVLRVERGRRSWLWAEDETSESSTN